jgi:hypothetical protein
MDNINVNPSGSTQIATEEINGVHYQKIIPVNETGEGAAEVEMNWLSRALFKVFGRFSFDGTSQLRTAVSGSVSVSSGTITTVSTVTTANISIGDTGKPATAQLQSAQCFYGTVGANFARS